MQTHYLKYGLITAGFILLTGCGGGGGSSSNNGGGGTGNTSLSGRAVLLDPNNGNTQVALSGLAYSTPSTVMTDTAANGDISYQAGENITFFIGNNVQVSVPGKSTISQQDIAANLCAAAATSSCEYNVQKNLESFFLTLDSDRNSGNGIQLLPLADTLSLDFTLSIDRFQNVLATQLSPSGISLASLFTPSLGINTEAPQAERDDVVQPMPFVDIFRTARPFKEYSCKDVIYDANGWPGSLPSSCAGKNPAVIRTFILDSSTEGAIPNGEYVVLYEGDGRLQYSGYAQEISHSAGRDVINITLPQSLNTTNVALNRVTVQLTSGSVRNIRIVMPGGICKSNPFTRVSNSAQCPAGEYLDFAETLAADRNAILFNPDYLRVLKDFRVVRMMNLMEASPSAAACYTSDVPPQLDETCYMQSMDWDHRGKLDDATWGGSSQTSRLERFGRGVPLEVQIELANQLNANPWFTIPHNATDDYVRSFAQMVKDRLKSNLKPHIEYTNEAWNGIFLAYHYVKRHGELEGLSNPESSFYAKRAAQIFKIWTDQFGSADRLVRILSTYQADVGRSQKMLQYLSDTAMLGYVDKLAMGAYFYGCWNREKNLTCQDTSKVPVTFTEVTNYDQMFAIMDNPQDPYGLPALKALIQSQATVASNFGKKLFVYEGGQHLVIDWGDTTISTERKNSLLDYIRAANRDPRMGDRYTDLLNAWKNAGGEQFMLYTLPQSFHRFGTFGIKESLTQPRSSAPKYDASMKFQETQGKCWWNDC